MKYPTLFTTFIPYEILSYSLFIVIRCKNRLGDMLTVLWITSKTPAECVTHTCTYVPSTHLIEERWLKVDCVDRGCRFANRYEQATSTPPISQVHVHAPWVQHPASSCSPWICVSVNACQFWCLVAQNKTALPVPWVRIIKEDRKEKCEGSVRCDGSTRGKILIRIAAVFVALEVYADEGAVQIGGEMASFFNAFLRSALSMQSRD